MSKSLIMITNPSEYYPDILLPRSIRNRNPGNLMSQNDNPWLWQMGYDEGDFCVFDTLRGGCRAHLRTLLTYYTEHDLHTIIAIICRWTDNGKATSMYIEYLVKSAGIGENEEIKSYLQLINIALGQEYFEAGGRYYDDAVLRHYYLSALPHHVCVRSDIVDGQ